MKKAHLLAWLLFGSLALSAQADLFSTPYKTGLKKWGVSFGNDRDMLGTVDHRYLLNTIRGETKMDYSNLEFRDTDIISMACDNPHLRLNATLGIPRIKRAELNLSAIFVGNKIDEVTYFNENSNYGKQQLKFQAFTNEIGLESVFLMNATTRKGGIKVYGGIGTNAAVSWGTINVDADNIQVSPENEIINFIRTDEPIEYPEAEYQNFYDSNSMKKGFNQRGFLQTGLSFIFAKRIELGFEYRLGVGYRAITGTTTQATQYRSGAISLSYIMK